MSASSINISMINITQQKTEERETFHIYILSFFYGFLLLIVLGHLVVRWQWRRVKGSRFPNHYPGDKSFKCKAIRQRLCLDFNTISKLTPDPTLINEKYEPKIFGPCRDGPVPDHWFRMKTCEAAASLVSDNAHLVGRRTEDSITGGYTGRPSDRHSRTEMLPDFVSRLQQKGILDPREQAVERVCSIYTQARFRDGEFPESLFREFSGHLQQVQKILQLKQSPRSPSLRVDPEISLSSSHQQQLELEILSSDSMKQRRISMEPLLLATSPEEMAEKSRSLTLPSSRSRIHKSYKTEHSPLISISSLDDSAVSYSTETPV